MLLQLGMGGIRKLQIKLCSSGTHCCGCNPGNRELGSGSCYHHPSLSTPRKLLIGQEHRIWLFLPLMQLPLNIQEAGNWYWTWSRKTLCLPPFRSHLSDLIGENLYPESWLQGSLRDTVFSSGRHTKSKLKLKVYPWQNLLALSVLIGTSVKGDVRLVYRITRKFKELAFLRRYAKTLWDLISNLFLEDIGNDNSSFLYLTFPFSLAIHFT